LVGGYWIDLNNFYDPNMLEKNLKKYKDPINAKTLE
jgi:hypothetical protein